MNKIIYEVPKWVQYLSDWSEDLVKILPNKQHYILDKSCTGCGATEYFINNNRHVILCAPRKVLLKNKHKQQKKHRYRTFLLENTGNIVQVKKNIREYLSTVGIGYPAKILVTYDSLGLLTSILKDRKMLNWDWQVVVDEFQLIFDDSRLKAEVELQFLRYLKLFPSVCYLSATPIMEKYLDQMEDFKDLPYYQLSWDPSHLISPNLLPGNIDSFYPYLIKEINNYLNGRYPLKFLNGVLYESKELLIFVNNVSFIVNLLKKIPGLTPDNTNIICAEDPDNASDLKKCGHSIGEVPEEGKPIKMFTICTKTAYIGTDFYNTSARTIICSDPNLDCMSTDIATDYPQILGRQRKDHPFKDDIIFLFKTTKKENLDKENFEKKIDEKINRTNSKLWFIEHAPSEYDRQVLLNEYRTTINIRKYKDDYVSIEEEPGKPAKAIFNKTVMLSEIRGFELQSMVYSDVIKVYSALGYDPNVALSQIDQEFRQFYAAFNSTSHFPEKMKMFCQFADRWWNEIKGKNLNIDNCFAVYWGALGTAMCEKVNYSKTQMDLLLNQYNNSDNIKDAFHKTFQIGCCYTLKDIKQTISLIYKDYCPDKSPKASDINQYFLVTRKIIQGKEGYQIVGFK